MKRLSVLLLLASVYLLCNVSSAKADAVYFTNISGNDVAHAAAGEAQLYVDVTPVDGQPNQVLFIFWNNGPEVNLTDPANMYISDVYFDEGHLLEIAGLIDADEGEDGNPNVDFSWLIRTNGNGNVNLPSGQNADPPFVATPDFTANNDPGASNGVDPGESLGVLFSLQVNSNSSDVLSDLNSGALRIGIHVQGFNPDGSESFVNHATPVHEPATMLLLGSGLAGLAAFRRKSRKK